MRSGPNEIRLRRDSAAEERLAPFMTSLLICLRAVELRARPRPRPREARNGSVEKIFIGAKEE